MVYVLVRVGSGKCNASRVHMLLLFVVIGEKTHTHLSIKCTQHIHRSGNTVVTFHHFLMLPTGITQVGELEPTHQDYQPVEVGDVHAEYVTRWTFVILTSPL